MSEYIDNKDENINSCATDESRQHLLHKEIFIQTSNGIVCVQLDAEPSTSNQQALPESCSQSEISEDDTATCNPFQPSSTVPSSDTGFDSDDQTSDCSEFIAPLTISSSNTSSLSKKKVDCFDKAPLKKRKGGWPKGRKRTPEFMHLPPKAPATGYNLYSNEMRKQYKDAPLLFYEVTKIIGNKWSNLSLEEKRPYLQRAEEDKERYKEELRVYKESGSYQLYLAYKRNKRAQNNVLSESDMDATDDVDDEDNEELYCSTCDQYFNHLHNKREHLQGRQHHAAVQGDKRNQLGATENGRESKKEVDMSDGSATDQETSEESTVNKCIASLISVIGKKEREFRKLSTEKEEKKAVQTALQQQVRSLKKREQSLKDKLKRLKSAEKTIETKLFNLWKVPSMFVTTDFTSDLSQSSEYLINERT